MRQRRKAAVFRAGVLVAICGYFCVASAWAAQGAYGFGIASELSSNIRQQASDAERDRIDSAIAGLAYSEDTADFIGRLAGQVEHRNYANDTFDDETLFTLDASGLWTLIPSRLSWTLVDSARQVLLDPTQPSTPTNRAGANVVETGPDMFFHLSQRQRLVLGARYGNVYVGDTDLDNNRYGVMLRGVHQMSPQLTASLNFEHLGVRYDDDEVNENFDRRDAYLRIESQRVHTRITLDGGVTNISRDRSGDLDGALVRLRAEHDITAASFVSLSASSGYSDVGSELLRYVTPPTTPADRPAPPQSVTDIISNDLSYERVADVVYGYRGARLGASVRAEAREIEFETATTGDRDETGVLLNISYNLSATLAGVLYGRRHDIKYREIDRDDEEQDVGVRLTYRARRTLTLAAEARRMERTSTIPVNDFVDDRLYVSLIYSTGPLFSPTTRR